MTIIVIIITTVKIYDYRFNGCLSNYYIVLFSSTPAYVLRYGQHSHQMKYWVNEEFNESIIGPE